MRTESVSAVDASAAQRFGWVYSAARPAVVAREPLPRAPYSTPPGLPLALLPALRAEDLLVQPRMKDGYEVALAARWIDALPVKVDAQDGGLLFAVRLRGP